MNAFTSIDTSAFSFLEWKVIEMARQDGPRSFNPDGLTARLARLVGMRVPNGLANESLEALRRFSVRAWYWDLIRTKDMQTIAEAGYSRKQVLEILSRISMTRGFMPTIEDDAAGHPSRVSPSNCRCG